LNISDCSMLKHIQLQTQKRSLEQMRLDWKGCNPQALVDWLQFLYGQAPNSPFFTLVKQALLSGVLNLCATTSNETIGESDRACLYLLLKWNIPITQLIMPIERTLSQNY